MGPRRNLAGGTGTRNLAVTGWICLLADRASQAPAKSVSRRAAEPVPTAARTGHRSENGIMEVLA